MRRRHGPAAPPHRVTEALLDPDARARDAADAFRTALRPARVAPARASTLPRRLRFPAAAGRGRRDRPGTRRTGGLGCRRCRRTRASPKSKGARNRKLPATRRYPSRAGVAVGRAGVVPRVRLRPREQRRGEPESGRRDALGAGVCRTRQQPRRAATAGRTCACRAGAVARHALGRAFRPVPSRPLGPIAQPDFVNAVRRTPDAASTPARCSRESKALETAIGTRDRRSCAGGRASSTSTCCCTEPRDSTNRRSPCRTRASRTRTSCWYRSPRSRRHSWCRAWSSVRAGAATRRARAGAPRSMTDVRAGAPARRRNPFARRIATW